MGRMGHLWEGHGWDGEACPRANKTIFGDFGPRTPISEIGRFWRSVPPPSFRGRAKWKNSEKLSLSDLV